MSETTKPLRPEPLDARTIFATIEAWQILVERTTLEIEPGSALAGDARRSPSLQVAHAA